MYFSATTAGNIKPVTSLSESNKPALQPSLMDEFEKANTSIVSQDRAVSYISKLINMLKQQGNIEVYDELIINIIKFCYVSARSNDSDKISQQNEILTKIKTVLEDQKASNRSLDNVSFDNIYIILKNDAMLKKPLASPAAKKFIIEWANQGRLNDINQAHPDKLTDMLKHFVDDIRRGECADNMWNNLFGVINVFGEDISPISFTSDYTADTYSSLKYEHLNSHPLVESYDGFYILNSGQPVQIKLLNEFQTKNRGVYSLSYDAPVERPIIFYNTICKQFQFHNYNRSGDLKQKIDLQFRSQITTEQQKQLKTDVKNGVVVSCGRFKLYELFDNYAGIDYKNATNEINFGWKFHISVEKRSIQQAFDLIAPIVVGYGLNFKVIKIDEQFTQPQAPEKRLFDNGQFTIYLEQNETTRITCTAAQSMIQEVTRVLELNNIPPSSFALVSDAKLSSTPYFSLRNDKFSFIDLLSSKSRFGTLPAAEPLFYIGARYSGANFNPTNVYNPFNDLVDKSSITMSPFNIDEHFSSFSSAYESDENHRTYRNPLAAAQISILAYINEYTMFSTLSQREREKLIGRCRKGRDIDEKYFKDPQLSTETKNTVKFAVLLLNWTYTLVLMKGNKLNPTDKEYINISQYSFDDSFKKVLEGINDICKMCANHYDVVDDEIMPFEEWLHG
ncbi:MAG: hypothetical protein QG673_1391 [Pseudomonadota bacterium]|nr:hypothetical protein [Pseudomonadota bacterium]